MPWLIISHGILITTSQSGVKISFMHITNKNITPVIYAFLAAVLYALSTPFSKLLLDRINPTLLAGLLYLGAGLGMGIIKLMQPKKASAVPFTKKDGVSIIAMIALDIAAPILLLFGLRLSHPESVALLNNFEIVATALFAFVFFKEIISKRLGVAIVLVTLASIVLSFEDLVSFSISWGALLVLLATLCWGLENNITRVLSKNDPLKVVIIKGLGAGIGSLLLAFAIGAVRFDGLWWLYALGLGFVAYGLSIFLYVSAQRHLGAATTSAFYGVAPFVGALLSLIIFRQWPGYNFFIGLCLMIVGAYFAFGRQKSEKRRLEKNGR